MTKVYLAGPMSGIPQFNYPAFHAAAAHLRAQDIEVINPAEMDDPKTQKLALASEDGSLGATWKGETWGDFLKRDVKIVADMVDEVCLLPGWEKSRGARLEAYVALSVQKPVSVLVDGTRIYYGPQYFMEQVAINTVDQGDVSRYG